MTDEARLLVTIAGSIYVLMGLGHAGMTLVDVYRPKYFSPIDDEVRHQMAKTGVRMARGRTSMWEAWLGFNISHGLGVVLFGLVAIGAASLDDGSSLTYALPWLIVVSAIYLALSVKFWFRTPTLGIVINTSCLCVALWLS